jgi:hypothetical protein
LFFWYKAHNSGKNSYSSKKSLTSPAFPSKYFSAKLDLSSEVRHNSSEFKLHSQCALYQKNNRGDIKSFFKEPFNFYKGEIDDLSASDSEKDKYKVCALVLCVIFNNRFTLN